MALTLALLPISSHGMDSTRIRVLDCSQMKMPATDAKPPLPKTYIEGKTFGGYYFPPHALARMAERQIKLALAIHVINYGDWHVCAETNCRLYYDIAKKIGIILDIKEKNVITVLNNVNEQRLNQWVQSQEKKKQAAKLVGK